jgi:hypothetical protein
VPQRINKNVILETPTPGSNEERMTFVDAPRNIGNDNTNYLESPNIEKTDITPDRPLPTPNEPLLAPNEPLLALNELTPAENINNGIKAFEEISQSKAVQGLIDLAIENSYLLESIDGISNTIQKTTEKYNELLGEHTKEITKAKLEQTEAVKSRDEQIATTTSLFVLPTSVQG